MATDNYLHAPNSFFGVGIQSAWGTAVAASYYQTVNAINIIQSLEGVETIAAGYRKGIDSNITYNRGRYQVSGDAPGPFVPDEMYQGVLWALLLGNSNTVTGDATSGYTHTFNEPDSNDATDWPGYIGSAPGRAGATLRALKGGFADTVSMFEYDSSFVAGVNVEIPENGHVMINPSFLGRKETGGATIDTPSYTDLSSDYPFDDSHADIQLGSSIGSTSSIEYKSASLNINVNPELVINAKNGTNSRHAVGVKYGKRAVDLSLTFDLKENMAIYDYFVNNTEIASNLILTHESLAGSSSGAYAGTFKLPRLLMVGDPFTVSGENNVELTANFQMMHDDTAGYGVQVVMVNSESGVYAV